MSTRTPTFATLAFTILATLLAACGSGSEPAATPRPATDRDGLVATPAGRMHLRCVGAGSTTIVLVAGWGDGGDSWGPVETGLDDRARVCSYARFGTGTSDAPTTDQTFRTQAASLHDLLRIAREPGPYLLVGHSFGGAVAVAFAAAHRDATAGLVLLDATPVDWIDAACAVPADGSEAAATFAASCAMGSNAANNPERLDAAGSFRDVAGVTDLGDLAMTVMFPSHVAYGDMAAAEQDRLRSVKAAGMQRWASLSTTATMVAVDRTGHYLQTDRPDAVITAIETLLP